MTVLNNKLTNKTSWENYWESKDLLKKIERDFWFRDIFTKEVKRESTRSFIEIGGYPGYFAVYFKKYFKLNSSLLDYYIDRNLIKKLLKQNGLGVKDVTIIKSDFLSYKSKQKYDLVFSYGFIEHFENTAEVIKKHWDLVKKNGKMIIIYPNFLGLNGMIQRIFDPDNLKLHNLESMDLQKNKINCCKIRH